MKNAIKNGVKDAVTHYGRTVSDPAYPLLRSAIASGLGDRVILRDAKGRSARPSLIRIPSLSFPGEDCLQIRGGFTVLQTYAVDAWDGAAFAEVSRDGNPLHRVGGIVPGAMTAARALLLPELLLEGARVERMKFRFRSMARYGLPTLNLFRIEPAEGDSLRIDVRVRQGEMDVADGQLLAGRDSFCRPETNDLADPEPTAQIRLFLECLCIDPEIYFQRMGAAYPSAYFASLPSGEMVRKYSGEGGLLNALDLEFPGVSSLESAPVTADPCTSQPRSLPARPGGHVPTTVELQDLPRPHRTFRKILARVAQGMRTYCSGFAMVMQPYS